MSFGIGVQPTSNAQILIKSFSASKFVQSFFKLPCNIPGTLRGTRDSFRTLRKSVELFGTAFWLYRDWRRRGQEIKCARALPETSTQQPQSNAEHYFMDSSFS